MHFYHFYFQNDVRKNAKFLNWFLKISATNKTVNNKFLKDNFWKFSKNSKKFIDLNQLRAEINIFLYKFVIFYLYTLRVQIDGKPNLILRLYNTN